MFKIDQKPAEVLSVLLYNITCVEHIDSLCTCWITLLDGVNSDDPLTDPKFWLKLKPKINAFLEGEGVRYSNDSPPVNIQWKY